MKMNINTPEGTRDRLFSECAERRQVQHALVSLFSRRGYSEVMTPEVEFYDLFVRSGNPLPQETMLKIIDRSGKIMVMRPDSTAPIARVAASKLKSLPMPQRLYYDQTLFRSGNAHEGGSSEVAQCGIELIGASGLRADAEMIAMAVDALRSSGLTDFHIEIGHAGLYRSLVARMSLSSEDSESLRSCIEGKNYAQLNDYLDRFSGVPAADALRRLPYLFGGAEVLEEAEQLFGPEESLCYLCSLFGELSAAGYAQYIRFDLGLVHQIDYYTGVVIRVYAEGAGSPVLSGGRYDTLLGLFGFDAEATGFAVNVDVVGSCVSAQIPVLQTLVYYAPGMLSRALQVLDEQPQGTCELSACGSLTETIELAKQKGVLQIIAVDEEGERWIGV